MAEKFKLVDLGKDGSKWKHGYIPENPAAVALKNHKSPGGAGAGLKTRKTPKTSGDHEEPLSTVEKRALAKRRVKYAPKVKNTEGNALTTRNSVGRRADAAAERSAKARVFQNYSTMTPQDKVTAVAKMYGSGSKQHLAAKRKFLK